MTTARKSVNEHSVSDRRRFRWRGPIATILLVPFALIALLSHPVVREDSWVDLAIDAVAWAVFLGGAGLRFWSTLYVGGRKDDVLVVDGPYSICRHPLYVGSLLLIVAGGLFLKSLLFAAALFLLILIYTYATVALEEHLLAARFGSEYQTYRDRVPRFRPTLRHFRTPARVEVHIHALRLEAARASRWVWIPFVGEALAHLRTHALWPQMFQLF